MRALHIAFVSPFFPLKGGIARFSSNLHEALLERGNKVDAISFKRLYPGILFRGKAVYEPGMSRKPVSDVLLLLDTLNPFSWAAVARLIRRRNPDLILCAYWTGLFAPLYALLRLVSGKRMIVLMHNYTSHERFPGEKILRDLLMVSADGVITLSAHVACQVKKSYPEVPVRSLFHPVYNPDSTVPPKEDACRQLGLEPPGPVLLFFGYVRAYKGLDILIDAMPEVVRRYPATRLLVAGEFYHGERLIRDRIERLGIGRQVKIYAEFVSNDRMPLFFSASDVVVLPYREASQSGVVQQAYGFGRPVVVSDRGGLPESVLEGRTGAVVRSLEPSALAESICDFLDSREKIPYERMVKQHARKFSWDIFAEKLESFSREVIG